MARIDDWTKIKKGNADVTELLEYYRMYHLTMDRDAFNAWEHELEELDDRKRATVGKPEK